MGLTLQGQGAHRTPPRPISWRSGTLPEPLSQADCSAGPTIESMGRKGAGCAVSTGTSRHSPQLRTWLVGENQSLWGSFMRH